MRNETAPFDWQPVWLSLRVASVALILVLIVGTLAAHFMARRRFFGQELLESVLMLPLVLPPVVTGYALLVLLGTQGAFGHWLEQSGVRLIFTPWAAILASSAVAFPLMYSSAKAAFLAVEPLSQDAAQSLGATPTRVFWTITVPLSWPGLLAGIVLSFARALGEFGATIMVAGNIEGQTTTVPTAIYMAAENGDLRLAGCYAGALAVFNVAFMWSLNLWTKRRR